MLQLRHFDLMELGERLRRKSHKRATVYRSMRVLENTGLAKWFDFGDGLTRSELLRDGDDGPHHHLVCNSCANMVEIEECFTRDLEERIARRNDFPAVTRRLEFFGVCPACQ